MISFYKIMPILFIFISTVSADVILDGTLGKQIELSGPNFAIEAKLGQQHGSNLFHSFQDFNLNSLESATFSGSNNIQNIISRVTGGNPSNIDGLIRSTIPNADMYFLNSYGIMFGPNAQLDVQGSFHFSTADVLNLGIGGQFNIREPEKSLLTVAPPSSFGFLTDIPADITLQDSILSVVEGKTLSLIGGNLNLNGELLAVNGIVPVFSKDFTTQLEAPNGRINIASIASKSKVILTKSGISISSGTSKGNFIIDHSKLTTSGKGGGDIFIQAGLLKLINSDITSDTLAEQEGGVIDIIANDILLDGAENYSYISSSSFGSGNAGRVNLFGKQLTLSDGAIIFTVGTGTGTAGSLYIKLNDTLTFSGKYIYEIFFPSGFYSSTFGTGQGGDIEIKANKLIVTDGGIIGSGTFGSKKSGNIRIKITETLTLSGRDKAGLMSGIYASTQPLIVVDSNYNIGDGGNIEVEVGKINILAGGQINSATEGLGNSGTINVKANELTASGKAFSEYWQRYFYSGVSSVSTVSDKVGGQAGNIVVQADTINLSNEGQIGTSAANAGGGNIEIKSNDLIYLQGGQITTSVQGGIGNGGNINIENPQFTVLGNNGQIKAQADAGHGGNITLKTEHLITSPDSLISASSRLGLDGNVKIDSPDLDMEGFLVTLPGEFTKISDQMKNPCNISGNSFIVKKINGSSPTPYDYKRSYLVLGNTKKTVSKNLNKDLPEKLAYASEGCKHIN